LFNNKYFNLGTYIRKAKSIYAGLCYKIGLKVIVVTEIDNIKISFETRSILEYGLRAQRSYSRELVTMYWLRNCVSPNDVVYDIGANVGAYSLYAGNLVRNGQGKVYSFEPSYENYYSLCRNIDQNKLSGIVIPYPIALSNSLKGGMFYLQSQEPGSALHGLNEPISEGKSFHAAFIQGAFSISLDELVSDSQILFPNHIKIDVDGSEREIVAGMKSILTDNRLSSIMIEINEELGQGLIDDRIIESGFTEVKTEQWPGKLTFNKLFCR